MRNGRHQRPLAFQPVEPVGTIDVARQFLDAVSRATGATRSIYGLSVPGGKSKYSLVHSRRTAGAKGRNDSRNLIFRFIVDCICVLRASPRCSGAECPGTKFHAPRKPAHDLAFVDQISDIVGELFVVEPLDRAKPALSKYC